MIVWIILAAIVLFIVVILIRTLCFKPEEQSQTEFEAVSFDGERSVATLGELIKCKTVSFEDKGLEDNGEFEKLISMLPQLYPNVFSACEYQRPGARSLLFRWKGKNDGAPAVLMAHFDVVPVEEENWTHPAFDALIEDGVMWGRGTLDTKVTFNGVLSAADNLISQGYVPENDIWFAFAGDEEIDGTGAKTIVEIFKERGITPAMVVDEGGAVVQDVFPGVSEACGLIGIAEKGMVNVEFSCTSSGGHASAPAPHTPVGILSAACERIENHPFPLRITTPAAKMFDTLGRHSTFLYRMIFANLWCFSPILDIICRKSGGEMNALLRTTVAFTQMSGSLAPNVIPPSASMVANIRLNPLDTIDSALEHLKKTINNESVEIKYLNGSNPSPISLTDCESWIRVKNAVEGTWRGCITAPYLMVQCSDSKHYGEICDKVYRFSAMDLTAEERHTIHGNDERIRLETAKRAVEFYIRLMEQC